MATGKISWWTWLVIGLVATCAIVVFLVVNRKAVGDASVARIEIDKLRKVIFGNMLVRKQIRKAIEEDRTNRGKIENEIDNILARFI